MKCGWAPSFGVSNSGGMARFERARYSRVQSCAMIYFDEVCICCSKSGGIKTGVSHEWNSIFAPTADSSPIRNRQCASSVKLALNRLRSSGITVYLPRIYSFQEKHNCEGTKITKV